MCWGYVCVNSAHAATNTPVISWLVVCQCRCQSLPQGAFEDLTPSMGYPTAGIILLPLLILTTAQMPPPSIWVCDTVNECAHTTPGTLQAAPNLAPTLDRRLVCVCVCV